MDLNATQEKILTDKAFVIEEVQRIQFFYGLKMEIRYGEIRKDMTESVAEHIYGMHVLAEYFMQLEDDTQTWNRENIYSMITWHDMDELETGDMIGYKKTDADRQREATAIKTVINKAPAVLRTRIAEIISGYQKQETVEARFVKALDKIEPLFQIYTQNGKEILLRNKTTLEDSRRIKDTYVDAFPYMKHFNEILNTTMDKEGFYTKVS